MVAVQFVRDFVDEQSNTLSLSVVRGETGYCIDDLRPLNQAGIAFQAIQAVCCGGNLALLNISIGDLWQFDPADKIVIIEDVGEMAYQLIRTLKYLQRIGFFKKAKAVIFGDFNGRLRGATAAEQEKESDDIKRYLGYFAESVNFPVLHTNKIGHGAINYPVIFNYPAVLSADGRLSFT